jgi:hypothetical protein
LNETKNVVPVKRSSVHKLVSRVSWVTQLMPLPTRGGKLPEKRPCRMNMSQISLRWADHPAGKVWLGWEGVPKHRELEPDGLMAPSCS